MVLSDPLPHISPLSPLNCLSVRKMMAEEFYHSEKGAAYLVDRYGQTHRKVRGIGAIGAVYL